MGLISKHREARRLDKQMSEKFLSEGWERGSFYAHEGWRNVFYRGEDKDTADVLYVVIDFDKKSAQMYLETFYESHISDWVLDIPDDVLNDFEGLMTFLDNNI